MYCKYVCAHDTCVPVAIHSTAHTHTHLSVWIVIYWIQFSVICAEVYTYLFVRKKNWIHFSRTPSHTMHWQIKKAFTISSKQKLSETDERLFVSNQITFIGSFFSILKCRKQSIKSRESGNETEPFFLFTW